MRVDCRPKEFVAVSFHGLVVVVEVVAVEDAVVVVAVEDAVVVDAVEAALVAVVVWWLRWLYICCRRANIRF